MTQLTNPDGKIFLALKTHMDTWAETPVHYNPDVPEQPLSDDPYVIVTDTRLDADTRYVGGNDPDEYRGTLSLSVMCPMGYTAAQSIGVAGRVADHWDKGAWYAYSDMRVQVLARQRMIGAGYHDAGMMRYPVTVKWRAVG